MRHHIPTLLFILLLPTAVALAGCTRERPTPEPEATVEALPVEPVTEEVIDEPNETVADPEVSILTPEAEEEPDDENASEDEAPQTFDYTVQSGDTLLSIALEYETDVESIQERNNLFDEVISVGQVLIVPYSEGVVIPGMPTATPGPFTYIVQAGETLGDIAFKFDVSPVAIIEASNLLDQNTLSVGQELIIPGYQAPVATSPGDEGDNGGTASSNVVHVVQSGESLGVIAEIYGVEATELARVNNVSNWNLLRVGQELIVPGVTRRDVAELRGQIHVVQSGESLSQIAAQYGIDVDELIALNEILDPNAIRVGSELIIAE